MSDFEEINRLHEEISGATEPVLVKAIRIGELLTLRRKELAHGEWLPWIKANLSFSQPTASRYIRLYDNRAKLITMNNLALSEALEMTEKKFSVEAKSHRNRARLSYIATHAAQPVIDALEAGKVSISTAEMVAHYPPEIQPRALADMPKSKPKKPDPKTVEFPVDPEFKDRLWHNDFVKDNAATTDLELDDKVEFSAFQRSFARVWRKIVREYLAEGLGYSQMHEQASDMMIRIGREFAPLSKKETQERIKEKQN